MKKFLVLILAFSLVASSLTLSGFAVEHQTYPHVTEAMLKTSLETCLEGGHPYLFGRKSDFERIASDIKTDPELAKRYRAVKLSASHIVNKEPAPMPGGFPEGGYLGRGFDSWEVVMQCGLVYLVEGDEAYAQRALKEALFIAELETWGVYQSISNNQIALAVAICYDWLYNYMVKKSPQSLDILKNALLEKHLNYISALFKNPVKYNGLPTLYFNAYYDTVGSNHSAISNSATVIQAMAVADEENIDFYTEIMAVAMENLHMVYDNFYPDGGWYEGLSYWSFTAPAVARMFACFDSAFGTKFGYEQNEYIFSTCYFPSYAQTKQGYYRYGDVSQGVNTSPEKFYLAGVIGDTAYQNFLLRDGEVDEDSALMCLWYDPDTDYAESELHMDKDKLFSNVNLAIFRSSWDSDQGIFCGMKVPAERDGHGNMDAGSFALDALGERWITNPGEDNYDLDGYWEGEQGGKRWNYYTKRAEANSCLVVNPSTDGGQRIDVKDTIDTYVSEEDYAYAISDLSDVYRDYVTSYKRGVALTDSRSRFVVRDEAVFHKPSEVYSFVNIYQSDITLTNNGKDAILSKGDKNVYVKIISDRDYTLSVMEAKALPTSPPRDPLEMDYTDDYRKLAIHFDSVESINVSMVFIPYVDNAELVGVSSEAVPLSEWDTSPGSADVPVASRIRINGMSLQNFSPYTRIYDYFSPTSYVSIEAECDDPEAEVEVMRRNASYLVRVSKDDQTTAYIINIPIQGEVLADSHMGGSLSVSASDSPLNVGQRYNYGSKSVVVFRDNKRHSVYPYYKISLPELPDGYEYKKVVMEVSQFRILGMSYSTYDTFGFYSIDPDSWTEMGLTHDNAPLRHAFDVNDWYPFKWRNPDGTYSGAATETMTDKRILKSELPRGSEFAQGYWKRETYDITPLAEEGEFAFMIASPPGGAGSDVFTASKEHPDESLRPRIYAVTGRTEDADPIYTGGIDFVNQTDSVSKVLIPSLSYRASAFAGNDTDRAVNMTLYIAAYSGNKLTGIRLITKTVPPGGTELTTELLRTDINTDRVQAFVVTDSLTPLVTSFNSRLEVEQ